MEKKIFVSYKYSDTSVQNLGYYNSSVRDYVDKLEILIGKNNIYKGEHDNEDLSKFTDEWIWTTLKEKIFDSSITIVLISPNMKEIFKDENEQWIPQEISYSLKEIPHNGRTSRTNALIYVVLPDINGNYNYFINSYTNMYNSNVIFKIMDKNLHNAKYSNDSYAIVVKWQDFVGNISLYINKAVEHQNNINEYNVTKNILEKVF